MWFCLNLENLKTGGTIKIFVYLKWESVLSCKTFKRGGTIKKVCVPKIGFGLNLEKLVYLKSGLAANAPM